MEIRNKQGQLIFSGNLAQGFDHLDVREAVFEGMTL
jgi:hypothetical protein